MSETFELDIKKYELKDLLSIFNLPDDSSDDQINEVYKTKVSKITENVEFEVSFKKDLLEFFKQAYYKLIRERTKKVYGPKFTNETIATKPQVQLNQDRYALLQQPSVLQNTSHFVIESNNQPTQDTFRVKYPNGVINPIRKRTVVQVISIDSLFRDNYKHTKSNDFVFKMPIKLNHVASMKLCSTEIPYTWYSVSEKNRNNKFTIIINVDDENFEYVITIPEGTWFSAEFADDLLEYFNKSGTYLNLLHFSSKGPNGKSVFRLKTKDELESLSAIEGIEPPLAIPCDFYYRIYFKYDDDDNNDDNNDDNDCRKKTIYNTFGHILGFKNDKYGPIYEDSTYTEWDKSYEGVLISESIFGANAQNYIFISINDYVGSSKDSIIAGYNDGNYLSKNILGRIQINKSAFFMNLDDNRDNIYKQRDYFGPVKIEKLRIQLLNKFGELIDLNDSDFSLALEFTQIYS